MVDSTLVLNGQTIAYTIYAIVLILLMAWFAYKLTKSGKTAVMSNRLFTILVIVLAALGVSLHLSTNATIPWVKMDLNRADIEADEVFEITIKDHQFILPEDKLIMKVGEIVVFDVSSEDLTYGFGIFRENHSMVCQMQVVPGHKNDLMWQFEKPGNYTIRSTEYSGPDGHQMILKDVVIVTE